MATEAEAALGAVIAAVDGGFVDIRGTSPTWRKVIATAREVLQSDGDEHDA